MIETRKLSSQDIGILIPMIKEYWAFEGIPGFDPQAIAEQLTRLLSCPQLGSGWGALENEEPVGYLLLVYVFSLEHLGLTAEVDEFFVGREFRGRGVGTALLATARKEAVLAGCESISLQVASSNDMARAFYLRHGFSERSGYELLEVDLSDR